MAEQVNTPAFEPQSCTLDANNPAARTTLARWRDFARDLQALCDDVEAGRTAPDDAVAWVARTCCRESMGLTGIRAVFDAAELADDAEIGSFPVGGKLGTKGWPLLARHTR